MALEILKQIEQAEGKAEGMRQDAQRDAREMLKSVEEACVIGERQAAAEQRAMAQSMLEEARSTTSRRLDAEAEKVAASREKAMAEARTRLSDAANLIFERVVGNGNR